MSVPGLFAIEFGVVEFWLCRSVLKHSINKRNQSQGLPIDISVQLQACFCSYRLQAQLEKVTMRVETQCDNFDWRRCRLSESQVHTHYRVATRNEVVPDGYMTDFEQRLPDVLQMDQK